MTDETAGAGEPVAKVDKQRVFAEFTPQQIDGMRGLVFNPRNFEEVWFLADFFSRAGAMVPEIYRNNKEACAMAIMWGLELQISPLQAITGITVIGGAPKVWGDLQHALVISHPEFESFREWTEHDAEQGLIAYCEVVRKGHKPVVRQFSARDAIVAGLAGKDTHKKYPQRMLPMRARSWAERDAMAHALRGLGSADEMIDVTDRGTDRTVERASPADEMIMPRALEHDAPDPLLQTVIKPAGDVAGAELRKDLADAAFAGMDDLGPAQGELKAEGDAIERVRAATPDHAALSGTAKPTSGLDKPKLTKGQRDLLASAMTAAGGTVSEQDVIDELGDEVHGGNIVRAVSWITKVGAERLNGG